MSKHETWRTRKYWHSIGGLLIEEFVTVKPTKDHAVRIIDGIIVIGHETVIHEKNHFDLSGQDVICIQTKKGRLGMNVMGQAFFSRELLKRFNPKSVKSVIVCGKDDQLLRKLCAQYEIEVVVIPDE